VRWTVDACFRSATSFLLLLLLVRSVHAQAEVPGAQHRNWDVGVWLAGATGEENLNSFSEAQTLTVGVFAGIELAGEIGQGWRKGRLEYGFDVLPVFRQLRPLPIYGGGFEPVILRWNSSLRVGPIAPFLELAGGALRTNTNFAAGDTSNFNFSARGGGGIRILTSRRRFAEIGCRWSHISNANLGAKNPEFNGIQVSLGYHWSR
jgi:hypothetical protein